MNLNQAIQCLPLYIKGQLKAEEMLQISRLLMDSPELMEEMQLALMLNDLLEEDLVEPPPFPQAIYQQSPRPALFPQALKDSYKAVKGAADVTQSALKMLLKFI